jgi:hypothetical protein
MYGCRGTSCTSRNNIFGPSHVTPQRFASALPRALVAFVLPTHRTLLGHGLLNVNNRNPLYNVYDHDPR